MSRCEWCGSRTMGCTGLCRTCKSKRHHAYARIERERLLVDEAGGSWWVWTARGEVVVVGRDTRAAAIRALATGDVVGSEGEHASG